MNERELVIKEILDCIDPKSIVEEWKNESNHVTRFKNIFAFMDRCKTVKATPENSITYYDEVERYMYIKFPYIACY